MHRPTNGQNSTLVINVASRVRPAPISTYLRPSGWTAGKRHLTVVVATGGFSSEGIGPVYLSTGHRTIFSVRPGPFA